MLMQDSESAPETSDSLASSTAASSALEPTATSAHPASSSPVVAASGEPVGTPALEPAAGYMQAAPAVASPTQFSEVLGSTVEPPVLGGDSAVTDSASVEAGSDEDAPPPLEAEPQGIIGVSAKLIRSKGAELAESERVKQSVQYIKDKCDQVTQNEKVQQSVDYVKTKTTEIAESERVRKSVDYAKEKAQKAATKASEVSEKVAEKTKESVEFAKEKARGMREGAASVWQSGRGSIQRVRANVSNMAWKGSARDTLDIDNLAREEQWKSIKVQGAEELAVPARTEHTCCYIVSKGSTLRWTFRVKDYDIGFGVRMRVQEWGGSREEEVLAVEKYDSTDTISGSWVADEDRTMVLVFDNKYSKLRSKTVAYFTGTEKPPVFVESSSIEAADQESQAEAASGAPTFAVTSAEAPASAVPAQKPIV